MSLAAHIRRRVVLAMIASALTSSLAHAQTSGDDENISNEYRLTAVPSHKINGNLNGFFYLGYVFNPEKDYRIYYLGLPGLNYAAKPWLQIWAGAFTVYIDNQSVSDKLELRPYIGAKTFIPNRWKWNLYNFSRAELRETRTVDSGEWTAAGRLRSRQAAEFPLSRARPWQPGTFYGLADAEVFYKMDRNLVDPLRLRAGLAYVLNDRVRLEFIYHAQYTHPEGSSLHYTDNIYRVNVKLGLHKGIIGRVFDPNLDD